MKKESGGMSDNILQRIAGDAEHISQRLAKHAILWLALFGTSGAVPALAGQGSTDNVAISMSYDVVSDGVNGASNPRAINGAVMQFTVAVTGPAKGSTAAAPFAINNDISDQMALYVGDIDSSGSGPVAFIENDSGLEFAFFGLSNADDALGFSNNGGQSFDYIPHPDGDGLDGDVTHIRIAPSGMLMPVDSHAPRFSIPYRTRIN